MMCMLGRGLSVFVVATALAAQEPQPASKIESPFGPATMLAQKEGVDKAPKCTLWVGYATARGDYQDHRQWLADLQSRLLDRAVRVVVAMPEAVATAVAAQKPGFAVAAVAANAVPEGSGVHSVLWLGSETCAGWRGVDGAQDRIEAALQDRIEATQPGPIDDLIESLVQGIGDGGEFAAQVESCVQALPGGGRARALTVLLPWWCAGDLDAARKAFDEGLQKLTNESVPLCLFADLVLRGDRTDPAFAKALAAALVPAAAGAPDGPFTQLVYLRALLRAGQDRLAGRVAATLPKHLDGRPLDQLFLAETLMEATDPKPYRDAAERALGFAEQGGVDRRYVYACRHKVLWRCGEAQKANELATEYRGNDAFASSLNNDAWYMVSQGFSMGRFDTLALAQVLEMQRLEGENMDHGNKDTVALVMFCNGRLQEAVDLQAVAARGAGNSPVYLARLRRFEEALAQGAKPLSPR